MIRHKWITSSICCTMAIGVLWLISACGQVNGNQAGEASPAAQGQQERLTTAARPLPGATAADPYQTELKPITSDQCGQCHPGVFQKIKENGKRHRFECQKCHQQFHSYNPQKKNWAEIMPQCGSCHKEPPHGKDFTACLECHKDPHMPLAIAMDKNLVASCGTCHTSPQAQLTKFPSAHTKQECTTCHTGHGLIPSCLECHTAHVPDQPLDSCKSCHPVHKPKEITYDASAASNTTCGSCHGGVFKEWSGTTSKHGQVTCAQCHDKHGKIPDCRQCHAAPHDAKLLQKYPKCLDCHINAHNLPIKTK